MVITTLFIPGRTQSNRPDCVLSHRVVGGLVCFYVGSKFVFNMTIEINRLASNNSSRTNVPTNTLRSVEAI